MNKSRFLLINILSLLLLLHSPEFIFSQEGDTLSAKIPNKDSLRSGSIAWVIDDNFIQKKFVSIDTTLANFHYINPAFKKDKLLLSLGNAGAPVSSLIFHKREYSGLFFLEAYTPYFTACNEQVFYNTKKPYSNIMYYAGPNKEQQIQFTHTQNVFKDLNLGIDLHFYKVYGQYDESNQNAKSANVNLWSQYSSERYKMQAAYYIGKNLISEFGGVVNDDFVYEKIGFQTQLDDAESAVQFQNIHFHQEWNLLRPRINLDTSSIEYPPFKAALRHTFLYNRADRFYSDEVTDESYYKSLIDSSGAISDRIARTIFSNSLGVNFNMVTKVVKPTLFFVFVAENEEYLFDDYFETYPNYNFSNYSFKGGAYLFFKNAILSGSYNQYIGGRKSGDVLIKAVADIKFPVGKDGINLNVICNLDSYTSDYLYKNIYTGSYYWESVLEKTGRSHIESELSFWNNRVQLKSAYSLLNNYTFFDSTLIPQQATTLSVFMLGGNIKFNLWRFFIESETYYQVTSDRNVLDLPEFSTSTSLYFKKLLYKDRLTIKLGAEVLYFTKFYANAYDASRGVFFNQDEKKLGDYPFLDAFLDLKYKRLRLSLKYTQLYALISGNHDYYTVLHYPQNPDGLYFSLAWHFYN